ncbi:MAG: hypothetical protein ABMA02_14015 [Saprospiraceae bacterium]
MITLVQKIYATTACLFLLSAFACTGDKERIEQERVAEQVAEFRRKEAPKCRASLLAEAGQIADSLLLYEALAEVNDSLRGMHPFRPVKPPGIPPIDSLPVKPLFDNNK